MTLFREGRHFKVKLEKTRGHIVTLNICVWDISTGTWAGVEVAFKLWPAAVAGFQKFDFPSRV